MSAGEMAAIIRLARGGDKLKIVFADNASGDELARRIRGVLEMHGSSVRFKGMARFALRATAARGAWEGLRAYLVGVLPGFDHERFIKETVNRGMLERVELV